MANSGHAKYPLTKRGCDKAGAKLFPEFFQDSPQKTLSTGNAE